MGAMCGAIGGAITGTALVLQSRRAAPQAPVPPEKIDAREAKDRRLVTVAGVVSGLIAALLGAYVAPLVVTALLEGSLQRLDLTIYVFQMVYYSPVCLPTMAIVTIPLGIGGGRLGLEIGRATGRPDSKFWIWCGAVVGGVVGYLLGSLVAFAIGDMG